MSISKSFPTELVTKYGLAGPRYTSYPTALQFHEGFDAEAYRRHAQRSNDDLIPLPLSLYVHLPFCESLCYYCACNKKVTRNSALTESYLQSLDREIEMQGGLFDRDRQVCQLHFGGGTPTYYGDKQLKHIMEKLSEYFFLSHSSTREYSIEIDPRTVSEDRIVYLADIGLNRVSMGIQDFDPAVQKAVNRIQDEGKTLGLIHAARKAGFNSVSVDLIYGLPLQTAKSFETTIDSVLTARPDRISVYNYAHLPHLFPAQRMISTDDVPTPEVRLELLASTISKLVDVGYVYIGMDHFALPDDDLSVAMRNGTLQRNFQGYSTYHDTDLVGLGVSAIGKVGNSCVQNQKDIRDWQGLINDDKLPVWRGIGFSGEDRLRREIISAIMCQGQLKFSEIEQEFGIDFGDHFALELDSLRPLQDDGLVEISEDDIEVTPVGLLLLRAIAMKFDEYLIENDSAKAYSKVI
ncbi:MAG: oxygen-independent coproporphyrinogen III oxidase [Gammaproteobacteria bacterium]|nr:MAG: oxygen-independent coproporphyrinogen III oxidase [Gammaproteobacteria bacterium]